MTLVIIVFYITVMVLEGRDFLKNNQKKEMGIYFIAMTAALVLSVLLSLGVKIPSPAPLIEKIVNMIVGG
ncbi:hypothetical protein [Clostridium sp. ZS2-4]|uniref:hypothetical protein n=1 Tax=Clostridium sp. ZS2-4 TaxID=2987703 RepID=UPI00227AB70C|nr:hypothetical protein [Clostridium sp. ZS2-4]MCY6355637.1 hypothetical protein [Clostridium sp. ZS2-4]